MALIYSRYIKEDDHNPLKADLTRGDADVVIAKITDGYYIPRGAGLVIDFDYQVNGEELHGHTVYQRILPRYIHMFIGASFPLLVSKKDHSEYEILILPADFEFFGFTYPDSLSWADRYMKE